MRSTSPAGFWTKIQATGTRQVQDLYLRVYSRRPTAEEASIASRDLQRLENHWVSQLEDQRDPAPRAPTARWRALGSLAHAMLNSNEFVYTD